MATRSEARRVRTDPRISRRRKAVARTKRRKVASALLGAVLMGAAVWGAFWSPLLEVRRVQVVGAKHTSADEVRAAVALGRDDNLLLVSTGRVAAAAEELPWVADAEVHRRLPGTVRIRLDERKAALVVVVATGQWTIDASGHVLEEGSVSDGLPTLTGAALGTLEPGDRLVTDDVESGLAVWGSLPKRIRPQVASVVAASRERVALVLNNGTLVRYGGPDRLGAKNKVLTALLARLSSQGRRATYIDVSIPSNPAVGPPPVTAATPTPTAAASPTPTP